MHLKTVAFTGFVTTVLLSTGFILYLTSNISTEIVKLRKHTRKTVFDDQRKNHHIPTSFPSKLSAPNMVKMTRQMASKSSLHFHEQQHLALNHAAKATGKVGIAKDMEMTRSTASEEFKHVDFIRPRLQPPSGTTTSPMHYRHSSSSPNKELQRGDVIRPHLRLSSVTTTSPIYYRHSSSSPNKELQRGDVIRPRLRTSSGLTTTSKMYQHSGAFGREQFQHSKVIRPRLQSSSRPTTSSPIYYQDSSNIADRENSLQPNYVPIQKNRHAFLRYTFSRGNQFSRNDIFSRGSRRARMTAISPKYHKYPSPSARKQFELGDVIKPRLQSSSGVTTTLPQIYYHNTRNTANRENIQQPNHVPMKQNWRAISRNTFPRRNMFSSNSTGYASSLYRRQSVRNISPQKRHFLTNLYRLIMARKVNAKELEMSRNVCTNDTCLLPQDPFPMEAEEDIFLQQANCLSAAFYFLNVTQNIISKTLNKCTCHLQSNVTKKQRIGLVSTPGSGNTWIRGLLEQVTEICTGSLWCDGSLRAAHFCGEGLRSPKTLIVKNHDPTIRWRGQPMPKSTKLDHYTNHNKPEFDAVIYIIRNPFRSLVAEHNRALAHSLWQKEVKRNNFTTLPPNDHVQLFGYEYFYNNTLWNETLYKRIDLWGLMVQHLLVDSKNYHVLLVHYENLKSNLFREMKRMVEFLDYHITEDTLRGRLDQKFTAYYRNHTDNFEHFTSEQKDYVNSVIASKVEAGLPVKQYICP